MFDVKLRDIRLKGRKFRNEGLAIGTLKRSNGDIIPISLVSKDVDKHLANTNGEKRVVLNFEGEVINGEIARTKKHVLLHNTINIDFIEVEA